ADAAAPGRVAHHPAGRRDPRHLRRLRPAGAGRPRPAAGAVRRAAAAAGGGRRRRARAGPADAGDRRPGRRRGLVPPVRGRRLRLGLYDGTGGLHHVGVAASFAAPLRRQLLAEVEPLREGALDDPPWRAWAEAAADERTTRMPGGMSRWNAQKDLSWEPLRIE